MQLPIGEHALASECILPSVLGGARRKRRGRRIDVRLPAVLTDSDGVENNVTVLDISEGGIRMSGACTLKIGEVVHLRSARGDGCEAEIRWTLGDEAGGVLLGSIDQTLRR